jgi:hypothetical protein
LEQWYAPQSRRQNPSSDRWRRLYENRRMGWAWGRDSQVAVKCIKGKKSTETRDIITYSMMYSTGATDRHTN